MIQWMQNRPIKTAIDGFIQQLGDVRKRSVLTQSHYRDYLNKFMVLSGIRYVSDITIERVDAFRRKLKKEGLSSATQNYYLIALRNFIRWLPENERPIDFKTISLAHASHAATPRASSAAITMLLDAPSKTKQINALLSLRDRALLELLHETSFKLYEMPELQKTHFDRAHGILYSPPRKNFSAHLSLQAARSLTRYLDARKDSLQALFISHDRSQTRSRHSATLSVRSIQRMVTKYSKGAGDRLITPRVLQKKRSDWTD
mgnify:CR=1 FL=1